MKTIFALAAVLCAYLLIQPALAFPYPADSGESFEVFKGKKPMPDGPLKPIPPITIDAKFKAQAHVTVPEEVVEAITKLVFKLQEEQKMHHQKHKLPVPAETPAQGDEPEKDEQPADEPQKDEQPAEEPQKDEQPAEEPQKDEQPAEEPQKVEQPAEEPVMIEQPAEEPVMIEQPAEELVL